MKTTEQSTFAERAGRALGQLWRGCVRLDRKANGWLVAQGLAPGAANTVLWVVKVAAFALLLYGAFWIALLLAFAMGAAWMVQNSTEGEQEEWAIGEREDHKSSVFYDPINYNDDPDPRFHDER